MFCLASSYVAAWCLFLIWKRKVTLSMTVVFCYTSISTSMVFYKFCTANGRLRNLFLRKFVSSQNQGFYENLTLRKFGAIQYTINTLTKIIITFRPSMYRLGFKQYSLVTTSVEYSLVCTRCCHIEVVGTLLSISYSCYKCMKNFDTRAETDSDFTIRIS